MRILDLFFPSKCKCMFCGSETGNIGICESCEKNLPFINAPTCDICGGKLVGKGHACIECKGKKYNFSKCYCVLEYKDQVQEKIISFKNGGDKFLGESFAGLIEKSYNEISEKIDIIIPIPINPNRKKERGFNQSEILCMDLLERGLVDTDIVIRTKDTPHQTGLSRENRINNLESAFEVVNKEKIKGKTILLVDDIYTTGSTLNECAGLLKKCGAKKVVGLCLARTPIRVNNIVQ